MTSVDCYKLYPCDGGILPFTSIEPFLSGYVDNYVVLEINAPNYSGDEKCFFVKYLGTPLECPEEYTIIENTTGSCECNDCVCYSFRLLDPTLVYYIDCDDNATETYLPTGVTTTVCSKVTPYFDTEDVIVVTNNGNCISGECPSNGEVITITPRNECDVITIFPMEVRCLSIQPSTPYSFDGAVTLVVTGGTQPYDIVWNTGSVAPLIANLDAGEYESIVTDFYGDFIIKTTCILTAETTTTTTTTTTLPPVTYGNLCVVMTTRTGGEYPLTQSTAFQFSPYTTTNGKQNWLSNDLQFFMYWLTGNTNQWLISGNTLTNGQIINNNPSVPPTGAWQVQGTPIYNNATVIGFTVYSGTCTGTTLGLNVTTNEVLCSGKGSIIIQAYGGTPPYQYSINNGTTFQTSPIFPNLGSGNYLVVVQDSTGNSTTPQLTTLSAIQPPQYSITLTINTSLNTFQITPSVNLPSTESISFTLSQVSTLKYYPPSSVPTPNYNNIFTFNGGLGTMTPVATTNTQNTYINLGCSPTVPITENQEVKTYTKTLTISGGQVITGVFTNQVNNTPSGPCYYANGTYTFYILTGASTVNCQCCPVQVVNPIQVVNTKV
jgi:hypothetical protein